MDSRELAVMRRQTDHFIKDNPVSLVMTRGGSREPDGAGGYTTVPGDAIQPQTMRLVPQQEGALQSRNVDGEEVSPEYVLIGKHDADIKTGDMFVRANRNYEVIWVRPDRRYEAWAEVVYRG